MGYFVWPSEDTAEAELKCALANLELWLKSTSWVPPPNYLLDMAIHSIERAKEKLKEEGRVGPNDNF